MITPEHLCPVSDKANMSLEWQYCVDEYMLFQCDMCDWFKIEWHI